MIIYTFNSTLEKLKFNLKFYLIDIDSIILVCKFNVNPKYLSNSKLNPQIILTNIFFGNHVNISKSNLNLLGFWADC